MPNHFYEAVYAAVLRIPAGRVATYGQIALLAGLLLALDVVFTAAARPASWAGRCTATPPPA